MLGQVELRFPQERTCAPALDLVLVSSGNGHGINSPWQCRGGNPRIE